MESSSFYLHIDNMDIIVKKLKESNLSEIRRVQR